MENDFDQTWRREFDDIATEMERISALANNVGRSFSSSLSSAIARGSSFNGVLKQITQSFTQLALKAALKPIEGLLSNAVGAFFQVTNPTLPKVSAFAKGGVINRPTYFPLQGGLGLAGESGAEAILPLRRDASGALGVAAQQSQPIQISMVVQAQDAASFKRSEAEIGATLLSAVRRGQRAS